MLIHRGRNLMDQNFKTEHYGRVLLRIIFSLIFFISLFSLPTLVVLADSSVSDSFTGTTGTLLENHTSDSGNTWVPLTGGAGYIQINSSGRARAISNSAIHVTNWTPASADYDVSADIYINGGSPANNEMAGIGGRASSTAFAGYFALLTGGATRTIKLYRGGNGTPLGTYVVTLNQGETHNLKLRMRSNNVKVYWDNVQVINATPTGGDIISLVGWATTYIQYGNDSFHLDNFLANNPAISAGTLSTTTYTSTFATFSWTSATDGIAPISSKLQKSLSGQGIWSDVAGATTSPSTASGLDASTGYDFRVAFTDSASTTVYSNTISLTTDEPSSVYSIDVSDLWDNGYDNITAPRQSPFSRFVFTSDASDIIVSGQTTVYNNYPTAAHLGLRIDGVDQSPLLFTSNGNQSFRINIGTPGTTRSIEIVSGSESTGGGATVMGSFIDSVTYPNSSSFVVQEPVISNRIVIYGDSISIGGNAINPESQGYLPLLRNLYGHSVLSEGWGWRALYDDTHTSGLRSAFVSRLASYSPSIIWLAIGTNDYGINKQSAVNFGTAYANLLDDLHSVLPSVKIACQTPILRSNESANGYGSTTENYRQQINTVCGSRSWTTIVDGKTILDLTDLDDGVHPSTAGHAKYALKVNNILTATSTLTTLTASSVSTTTAVLNGEIISLGSTTPTTRGFIYGTTTDYTLGTTTESGAFSIGSFESSLGSLSPNTEYYYKSYAVNFAGFGLGEGQTFTTLVDNPTNFSATALRSSISLSVDSFSGDTSGLSGYYFSRDGSNSGWIQTNLWQDTGLSCNTTYEYSVKYRNAEGVETESVTLSQRTSSCGSRRRTVDNTDIATTTSVTATTTVIDLVVSTSSDQTSTSSQVTAAQATSTGLFFQGNDDISKLISLLISLGMIGEEKAGLINSIISSPSAPTFIFTKDLQLGQTDTDVKELQKFLNKNGFAVAEKGPGSLSNESNYFGIKTKEALKLFQKANKISPVSGYFGSLTRASINSYSN